MNGEHSIQRIQTFVLNMPVTQTAGEIADEQRIYPMPGRTSAQSAQVTSLVVRLETASGIVGWGEITGPDSAINSLVIDEYLAPLVVGTDPFSISVLWERMRGQTNGRHLGAIGAVDMALWDIAGQIAGVPACKLMGGQIRDRIPVIAADVPYATGDTRATEQIKSLTSLGYRTVKIRVNTPIKNASDMFRPLQSAVSETGAVVISTVGADDFALARQIGNQAQAINAAWFESPLSAGNLRDASRLAEYLDIPVAGGSNLQGRWQFNVALAASAFDIVHVNVGFAGGISEALRIITLADTYGLPFVTVNVPGTTISRAAALQVAAAGANLMGCEWPLSSTPEDSILRERFTVADGYVSIKDSPGLGVRIDEAELKKWYAESA